MFRLTLMTVVTLAAYAPAVEPDPPPVIREVQELRKDVADLKAAVARIEAKLSPPAVKVVPKVAASSSVTLPAPAVAAPVPTVGPGLLTTRTTTATVAERTSLTPAAAGPVYPATPTPVRVAVTFGGTSFGACANGNCPTDRWEPFGGRFRLR